MKHLKTIFGILAILVSVGCFLRCWDYGIVNLDDYIYLTSHASVHTWQGWASVWDFLTNVKEGIWMPLTWFSYAADCAMFGRWYGGFHLHSIAIHAVNACLVWWFLRLVFRSRPCAEGLCLIGALIWAIHPLRCESVVFLASRKDVLSFFWEILALICWVRGGTRNTVWASVFFVVGSCCKPSVMTFPVLCFLIDAFVLRRVRTVRYVFPVLYMLFLGGFAAWQQSVGGATCEFGDEPLWGRVLGACAGFGIYLRNFVWPQWLAPQCVNIWPRMPRFLLPGLVISAVYAFLLCRRAAEYWGNRARTLSVRWREDFPALLTNDVPADPFFAGVAWFAVAIAPMLGIANFGYHAFADRFTYIPAVGLSIATVCLLDRAVRTCGRRPVLAFGVACVCALLPTTWRQTGFWENDLTLFSRTLEVDGEDSGFAHRCLGDYYFEVAHDLERAAAEYEKGLRTGFRYMIDVFPLYVLTLCELGREDEVADKLDRLVDEIERRRGHEIAMRIMSGKEPLEPIDGFYRTIYFASKIAWWVSDRRTLDVAEEALERGRSDIYETDPLWVYLRWKFHALKGDKAEADRLHAKLTSSALGFGYVTFRFLRKD